MTQTVAGQPIRNHDEREILRRYALGADVGAIVTLSSYTRDRVADVITRIAGFDRGRARQAVADYDKAMATPNGREAAQPKVVTPRLRKQSTPAPSAGVEEPAADPAEAAALEPEPQPDEVPVAAAEPPASAEELAEPVDEAPVVDVAAVLADAEASDLPAAVKQAHHIRALVAELAALLAADERKRVLRAAIEEYTRRRDEAAEELRLLTGKAAPRVRDGQDNAAIRRWAKDNGVECPARGRIPHSVAALYDAEAGAA